MALRWGWRISKLGKSVFSTDARDRLIDSDYNMLKIASDNSNQLTFTPGDTDQHVDITHGLGYTPAFIAYYVDGSGVQHFIPQISSYTGFDQYAYAYSDSTKVRTGLAFAATAYNSYNSATVVSGDPPGMWDAHFGDALHIVLGKKIGNIRNGAFRFIGVTIPQGTTLTAADIHFGLEFKGAVTTSLKYTVWGINEDNTADFSSDPMGRSKTSANDSRATSMSISTGTYFGISVLSEAQEIINRGGWSSGNAMGFILEDNGTDDNCWAEDDNSTGINTYLTITYGGNTTLTFRTIIFKDKIA